MKNLVVDPKCVVRQDDAVGLADGIVSHHLCLLRIIQHTNLGMGKNSLHESCYPLEAQTLVRIIQIQQVSNQLFVAEVVIHGNILFSLTRHTDLLAIEKGIMVLLVMGLHHDLEASYLTSRECDSLIQLLGSLIKDESHIEDAVIGNPVHHQDSEPSIIRMLENIRLHIVLIHIHICIITLGLRPSAKFRTRKWYRFSIYRKAPQPDFII